MARARTGNVEPFTRADGTIYYRARIRLADGSRVRVNIPEKHAGDEASRSRYALARQQLEDEKGGELKRRGALAKREAAALAPKPSETLTRWVFDRYIPAFKANGHDEKQVRKDFAPWVLPVIGSKPIASLKREHALAVRAKLVDAVTAEEIGPKRATDVFSAFCTAMGRAFTDDDPQYAGVRVGPAASNPCLSLKPPFNGSQKAEGERERQCLYPRKFSQLMACAAVPVAWRRIHALAVGLFLRPEEFYALTWDDVDLDAEEVSVTKTKDLRSGVVTSGTKMGEDRKVPIVPMLMPLLVQMKKEVLGVGAVARIPSEKLHTSTPARAVREHLELAGVMTDELRSGTSKKMPFDFRSWRTTGETWHAMNGVDSYVLASWAGHAPDMAWQHYIKQGPDLRRRYGEPFPTLPDEVIKGTESGDPIGPPIGQASDHPAQAAGKTLRNGSGRGDLKSEPALTYSTAPVKTAVDVGADAGKTEPRSTWPDDLARSLNARGGSA